MRLLIRNINQGLAQTTSVVGYHLWRYKLQEKQAYYAGLRVTGRDLLTRCHASGMDAGLQGALYVRHQTAHPELDRVVGTGWDNARPPDKTPATALACVPDIDRLDLGTVHRALAKRMGGSDAAVLALHPMFFTARMARHAIVGGITGVGFVGGCIVGACGFALNA